MNETSTKKSAGRGRKALVALVVALLFSSTTTPAQAVQTPNAFVYAVVRSADGWRCSGWANRMVDVRYFNHTTGRNGGDGGDDVVYMPVRLNTNNSVTVAIRCSLGTYIPMNYTIRPTRNNQTFFFNLNGAFTIKNP